MRTAAFEPPKAMITAPTREGDARDEDEDPPPLEPVREPSAEHCAARSGDHSDQRQAR